MLKELIQSLKKTKAQVETLEAKVEKGLKDALAKLPAEYGFDSVGSFLKAVKKASGEAEKRGRQAVDRALPKAKRAKITAAIRATVKDLVKAGKSAAEIAKAVGISPASVQNVKKASGLVRTTKKKAPRRTKAKKKASPAPAKRKTAPKPQKRRPAPKKTVPAVPAPVPAATEAPSTPAA